MDIYVLFRQNIRCPIMSLGSVIQSTNLAENINTTNLSNGLINDFNNKVLINDLKAESLNSVLSTRENISNLIDEIEALSK